MTTKVNQKEYLKKYLSSDKSEKKKKKKKDKKPIGHTMKIIDDDIDISKMQNINDDELDLMATGEDAPMIVGVIDFSAQDYKNSSKWRVVSNDDGFNSSLTVQQLDSNGMVQETRKSHKKKRRNSDDDRSVSKKKSSPSPDLSPRRKRSVTPDLSPKRVRGRNPSPDLSPRRTQYKSSERSPKRRSSERYRSRKNRRSSDVSPQGRNSVRRPSPHRRTRNYSPDMSLKRRNNDRYVSPRRNRSPDKILKRKSRFTDLSPPRKEQSPDLPYQRSSKSLSPSRNINIKTKRSPSSDLSPKRSKDGKMTKTLDGKVAGLQNAATLRIENDKFKRRENELFEKMTDELTGRNAEVVMRDKGTGKKRDFEMEAEQQKKKDQKDLERKAIYDKWGKGLKQVEEYRTRIAEDIHEMNKPLARYSDDNDLDVLLKKKERLGDPMLEYMRQKDREKRKESGIPIQPIYEGGFPDNRFNIRPGYRWDGVDRSNGYEKKWFDVISSKKAVEEEAYRYSTEDM